MADRSELTFRAPIETEVRMQMWKSVLGAAMVYAATVAATNPAAAADAAHPTVVELFQSQGCSSCPPANANVIALSERPDLLTLSFGVTYWDQLGWKDTFASPQFTQRQWDYARALHHTEVFTPQVVVNGRADVVGQDRHELEALIAQQKTIAGSPDVSLRAGSVTVGPGAGSAQVWLVRYDPNIEMVAITRGENDGRTLPHKNVVKELVKLGEWSGKSQSFRIPAAATPGLRDAVLVQDWPGGAILAAARE
jgi:hypothetical protein